MAAAQRLTIAVTGAAGQIGTAVVRHALAEGHGVVALDLAPAPPASHAEWTQRGGDVPSYTYRQVELTDHAAFQRAAEGCDALIHLAATYSLQNPQDPDGPLLREIPEHVVHNTNTAMSWNALSVAAALGIRRVALASSVNAIGLIFSKRPQFDYLPLDEQHACRPEDAYSACKLALEAQADAFVRRHPAMRVASLRPHWVIPETLAYDPAALDAHGGTAKDLWGWVSEGAVARAFVLALTASADAFPAGTHETFFVVAPTTARRRRSAELVREHFPEAGPFRRELVGNEGLFDCSKARRMLGWSERGFPWSG